MTTNNSTAVKRRTHDVPPPMLGQRDYELVIVTLSKEIERLRALLEGRGVDIPPAPQPPEAEPHLRARKRIATLQEELAVLRLVRIPTLERMIRDGIRRQNGDD